ncbi:MBL fold metallo-hydrolase [Agrobacterium vitis]|uniref:MBL fold metallo-hydrolase n=1 Tax=Agrobacterium vitis TaxID=373 RepID=UPI0018D2444D
MTGNTFKLGDWDIIRIPEIVLELPPEVLIPDWNPSMLDAEAAAILAPTYAANSKDLAVPVHSWLLKKTGCNILIDTGVGNGRDRKFAPFTDLQTDFLERLRAAGVSPTDINYVLSTHLHTDHVGWNTLWDGSQWAPSFPNARYVWGKIEGAVVRRPFFHDGPAAGVYQDSIAPIIAAGLADEVDHGAFGAIEGIAFHSTPGHSPGHMSISLCTDDGEAFFGGDVLHNQAQVFQPEWNSLFCEDPETARRSRKWALGYAADHDVLFFGTHIGGSSAGRVRRAGAGFTWIHK